MTAKLTCVITNHQVYFFLIRVEEKYINKENPNLYFDFPDLHDYANTHLVTPRHDNTPIGISPENIKAWSKTLTTPKDKVGNWYDKDGIENCIFRYAALAQYINANNYKLYETCLTRIAKANPELELFSYDGSIILNNVYALYGMPFVYNNLESSLLDETLGLLQRQVINQAISRVGYRRYEITYSINGSIENAIFFKKDEHTEKILLPDLDVINECIPRTYEINTVCIPLDLSIYYENSGLSSDDIKLITSVGRNERKKLIEDVIAFKKIESPSVPYANDNVNNFYL